jgi:TPR repeat protein
VEKDTQKAVEYFKLAAEMNHIKAIYNLAKCFFNGTGININFIKSFELFQRIIELNEDPQFYLELFYFYSCGYGIERDILQSIKFLITSSNLEYNESFV